MSLQAEKCLQQCLRFSQKLTFLQPKMMPTEGNKYITAITILPSYCLNEA